MKFYKLSTLILLFALLSACGQDAAQQSSDHPFKIKGIFGLSLNDKGQDLTEGYIIENKAFDFIPATSHPHLIEYTFSVTPNTHLIYGIKAKGNLGLPKETCQQQRQELIQQTLTMLGTDKTQLKVIDEGNKWKIREANQREIIIDCEQSINMGSLQLVVTYQDTSLSLLAYKEWKKRQSDLTKFRP